MLAFLGVIAGMLCAVPELVVRMILIVGELGTAIGDDAETRRMRFSAEGTPARAFELVSTNAMPSGIVLSSYKAAGPLKTG